MRDDGVLGRQWEEGNVGQAWEHCTGRVCGDSLSVRKISKDRVWKWEGTNGVKIFVGSCAEKSVRKGGQGPKRWHLSLMPPPGDFRHFTQSGSGLLEGKRGSKIGSQSSRIIEKGKRKEIQHKFKRTDELHCR